MKLKNILKLAAPVIGLVFGSSCKESMDNKYSKIIVDAGTFETGKGEFLSKNFYGCSAIIFDYGDSTIFSHAYPDETVYNYANEFVLKNDCGLNTKNVVNKMLHECEKNKIPKKNLFAYVFSGDFNDLEKICKEITSKNIPIKNACVYKKFEQPREVYDIYFNSLTNKYKIKSSKFFKK